MKRRSALTAGVAVAAATGGAWWGLRRQAGGMPAEPPWTLQFERAGGGQLAMAAYFGRPLVLNFWATWCPPCVKEMPQLDQFHRDFGARGWQVIGLAMDRPEPVAAFLAKLPVSFPIALAGLAGADLGRTLGNQAGALPFTAVFDAAGTLRHRKLGETSYQELAGWANQA